MAITHTTPFVTGRATAPYRPRVARETRRLLLTVVLALLTLWMLARLRFPERPVATNPVPPLLTQLARPPRFSDLASMVASVRAQVSPFLASVGAVSGVFPQVPALRIGGDLAVALLDPRTRFGGDPPGLLATDPVTGLALIRIPETTADAIPLLWQPQGLEDPRYLIAASAAPEHVWVHPIFIGQLSETITPRWHAPVWTVPAATGLSQGAIVFTENAELVGMAAARDDGLVIVPARELLRAAATLRASPPAAMQDMGVDVEALTPRLSVAGGTDTGVVVTWVDPVRVAGRALRPGDVVVAVNAVPVRSVAEWQVRLAGLAPDAPVILRVVRSGAARDVTLERRPAATPADAPLGLTMRRIAGVGAEILRVLPVSAAASAGLEPGDLVTAIGGIDAPAPARIESTFANARPGQVLIVAVTRRATHHVVGLQR